MIILYYNNNSKVQLFISAWETCQEKKNKPHLLNTVWQCQLCFLHSRKSELSFQPDDGIGVNQVEVGKTCPDKIYKFEDKSSSYVILGLAAAFGSIPRPPSALKRVPGYGLVVMMDVSSTWVKTSQLLHTLHFHLADIRFSSRFLPDRLSFIFIFLRTPVGFRPCPNKEADGILQFNIQVKKAVRQCDMQGLLWHFTSTKTWEIKEKRGENEEIIV